MCCQASFVSQKGSSALQAPSEVTSLASKVAGFQNKNNLQSVPREGSPEKMCWARWGERGHGHRPLPAPSVLPVGTEGGQGQRPPGCKRGTGSFLILQLWPEVPAGFTSLVVLGKPTETTCTGDLSDLTSGGPQ